ncbi:inner-membrane translocator [[Clostridium] cellulosi]|jgi:nucleoside ABC transporter membrane protein|uniref:Inner-membrane translocator n=1 Tax=[Clostridium] cellulosi TaxID=29343 RepID=A0A078KS07_9FIRM|nr:inner-membrane translocator [[Clostridium] cellulosi]
MDKSKRIAIVKNVLSTIIPIIAAFIVGGIVIAAIGEDPLTTYGVMIQQSLFSYDGILKTLHFASPLILTALAIAVTFKANVYNMAVEGSAVLGGFFAAVVGFSVTGLSPVAHITLCLAVGVVAGVVFTIIPALLKAYLNVDEMVVTLMLNYALVIVLQYLAEGVFKDPSSGYVSTYTINNSAMFQKLFDSNLTSFFFIAIAVFIIMYFVFKKSKLGYEITAMGFNSEFSEAAGMNVRQKIIIIMLISGALSGLAGAGYMMSEKYRYTLDFSGNPGLGWTGMLIALVGRKNPIGILIAAIFFAALQTGSDYVDMFTNVPKNIVGVVQGIIILFVSFQLVDMKFHITDKIKAKFQTKNNALQRKAAK